MKTKIKVESASDRDALAVILIRNGYTVKIVKEKTKTNRYDYFVEYWRE